MLYPSDASDSDVEESYYDDGLEGFSAYQPSREELQPSSPTEGAAGFFEKEEHEPERIYYERKERVRGKRELEPEIDRHTKRDSDSDYRQTRRDSDTEYQQYRRPVGVDLQHHHPDVESQSQYLGHGLDVDYQQTEKDVEAEYQRYRRDSDFEQERYYKHEADRDYIPEGQYQYDPDKNVYRYRNVDDELYNRRHSGSLQHNFDYQTRQGVARKKRNEYSRTGNWDYNDFNVPNARRPLDKHRERNLVYDHGAESDVNYGTEDWYSKQLERLPTNREARAELDARDKYHQKTRKLSCPPEFGNFRTASPSKQTLSNMRTVFSSDVQPNTSKDYKFRKAYTSLEDVKSLPHQDQHEPVYVSSRGREIYADTQCVNPQYRHSPVPEEPPSLTRAPARTRGTTRDHSFGVYSLKAPESQHYGGRDARHDYLQSPRVHLPERPRSSEPFPSRTAQNRMNSAMHKSSDFSSSPHVPALVDRNCGVAFPAAHFKPSTSRYNAPQSYRSEFVQRSASDIDLGCDSRCLNDQKWCIPSREHYTYQAINSPYHDSDDEKADLHSSPQPSPKLLLIPPLPQSTRHIDFEGSATDAYLRKSTSKSGSQSRSDYDNVSQCSDVSQKWGPDYDYVCHRSGSSRQSSGSSGKYYTVYEKLPQLGCHSSSSGAEYLTPEHESELSDDEPVVNRRRYKSPSVPKSLPIT